MNIPTFLVCTMHSGEPDWPYCQAMIAAQKNVIIKHQLISGLSEIDAHNTLYRMFNEADPSWIRAKIDADVVLSDEHMLERISLDLAIRPNAPGLMPFVHDHLSDSDIKAGVMFYTSKAKFKPQLNPLKCDRDVLDKSIEASILDWYCVGRHMYYANEQTAFRYGLHRGLKGQTHIMNLTKKAYERYRDPVRLIALKGFNVALTDPRFSAWAQTGINVPKRHNYEDTEFKELFQQASSIMRR